MCGTSPGCARTPSACRNDVKCYPRHSLDRLNASNDSLNKKKRCEVLRDSEGHTYETTEEKRRAFTAHNLIVEPETERVAVPRQARQRPREDIMIRIGQALRKARNDSAPEPDGISWKLLKALKGMKIGRAVLEDAGQVAETESLTRMPEEWRDMKMVMIPKPGNSQGLEANSKCGWQVSREFGGIGTTKARRAMTRMGVRRTQGERGDR